MNRCLKIDSSPLQVAVIGCGEWGKKLGRNFAELGVLGAVCDTDPLQAKALAARYDVPILSEQEIFAHPSFDAVVIASLASLHVCQAEQALKAGKHVYIEKPMALSTKDAERLCALAETQNRLLMVGHILNYHPAFMLLKERLLELGPLKHIYANRLGLGRFRPQENVLWDLASHDISLILALVQEKPQNIMAFGQAYLAPGKPASALLTLAFSGGLTAHIHTSWLSPFKEQKLVVMGEKAIAVFDDRKPWEEKLQISTNCLVWQEGQHHANDGFQTLTIPLPEAEPLKNECAHFLMCIQKGEEPLTSGWEGLRVTEVLEAAENSLREKENNA
jgi:UDP-2-acetamido-3-amino-2,3-dideoxy-glucuronate N-acetyltransferase